jgi:hypothetical protein
METEIDINHVHNTVAYKRWHNGTNKNQVPGSVEQPGLNFGLVRRLVGNDPVFNHSIRNGRNLESVI